MRDGDVDYVGCVRDAIGADGLFVDGLVVAVAVGSGSLRTAWASKPIVPSTPVVASASSNVDERAIAGSMACV